MDLVAAIDHAHMILGWHANLPAKELPPVWMWHLDHELERWFEDLNADKGDRDDDDESVPMMRNALVAAG